MPGIANPTIFDDIPTKRPHFFFLIVGKKYFTLKKCESKFVAMVFRHVGRSSSSIERFGFDRTMVVYWSCDRKAFVIASSMLWNEPSRIVTPCALAHMINSRSKIKFQG